MVRRQLTERTTRAPRPRGKAGREWWEGYLQREPYTPGKCVHHTRTDAVAFTDGALRCEPCFLEANPPRIFGPVIPGARDQDYLKVCERAAAARRRLNREDTDDIEPAEAGLTATEERTDGRAPAEEVEA